MSYYPSRAYPYDSYTPQQESSRNYPTHSTRGHRTEYEYTRPSTNQSQRPLSRPSTEVGYVASSGNRPVRERVQPQSSTKTRQSSQTRQELIDSQNNRVPRENVSRPQVSNSSTTRQKSTLKLKTAENAFWLILHCFANTCCYTKDLEILKWRHRFIGNCIEGVLTNNSYKKAISEYITQTNSQQLSPIHIMNFEFLMAYYFWKLHNKFRTYEKKPQFTIEDYEAKYGVSLVNAQRFEGPMIKDLMARKQAITQK